jgi:hypothetical protein
MSSNRLTAHSSVFATFPSELLVITRVRSSTRRIEEETPRPAFGPLFFECVEIAGKQFDNRGVSRRTALNYEGIANSDSTMSATRIRNETKVFPMVV